MAAENGGGKVMGEKTTKTEVLNQGVLLQMIRELEQEAELHSICILEEGKTVFEGAWEPFSLEVPQMMHSLSKTGTSLCVGMAVSEGKLSLTDSMLDYLQDDLPETYDPALKKITVYDLLTMQAGSRFCANNVWFTHLKKDWESTWLKEKRNADEIGNGFHYDSGCSYTLSRMVTKVMGKTCLELLQERVFSKMGLPEVHWLSSPEGYSTGGWGMYLTAPWIAALGELIRNNGVWSGEQLVPAAWIREMVKPRVSIPEAAGHAIDSYGYQIKTGEKLFAAEGAFGQMMIVFRDLPVVIGVTSGTASEKIADICQRYILEAAAVPASTEEEKAACRKKAADLHLPLPEGGAFPEELYWKLKGKKVFLDRNPRDVRWVEFDKLDDKTLQITANIGGEKKELAAGWKTWIRNDLYPQDFTKRYHCAAYAYANGKLEVAVSLINTSYREVYTLDFMEKTASWKPNVTYLDNNDCSPRIFAMKMQEDEQ